MDPVDSMKRLASLLILALLACSAPLVAANPEETEVTMALSVLANAYPALRSLTPPWVANYTGGGDLCSWSGITCDANRKVAQIVLANLNLNGPFYQEWFNFTTLKHLELRNVGFNGPMPSVIENRATYLSTLIITGNPGLTGNFPNFIGLVGPRVPGVLTSVDFSRNGFSGPFPNNFLSPDRTMGVDWLGKIDFSYNAFSGPITINCTHAPASVNLRSNQLSGTITPCDWPVTSTLDLAFNNFDGAFPAARAKYIDISHNGFTSVDAYMASTSFSAVQSFDASFNNISTAVPAIAANVNAYLIDLSHNAITGAMGASWNGAAIKYLKLHNNQITALWPTPGTAMNQMQILDVSNNPITSIPTGFASFGISLAQFFCTSCQLSGAISSEITNLPVLQELKLGLNSLSGDIAGLTFKTSSLTHLDISENNFNGIALPVFRNLTAVHALTSLYIQGNAMTMCDSGALTGSPLSFNNPSTCYADQTGSEIVSPACSSAWSPCHLDFVPLAPPVAFIPPTAPVSEPSTAPDSPSATPAASTPDSPSATPASSNPSAAPSSAPDAPSSTTPSDPPTNGSAAMNTSLLLILAALFALTTAF